VIKLIIEQDRQYSTT